VLARRCAHPNPSWVQVDASAASACTRQWLAAGKHTMSLQWDAPGLTILSASMEVHCSHLVDPVLRIKFGAHCSHGAPGCVLTMPLEHAKHPCARASYCRVCRRDSSGSFQKRCIIKVPGGRNSRYLGRVDTQHSFHGGHFRTHPPNRCGSGASGTPFLTHNRMLRQAHSLCGCTRGRM